LAVIAGEKIINPVTNTTVPDLKSQGNQAREVCDKNQTFPSADRRKSMTFMRPCRVPQLPTFGACGRRARSRR
jgi:hypothetical protein